MTTTDSVVFFRGFSANSSPVTLAALSVKVVELGLITGTTVPLGLELTSGKPSSM